jgi:microcystin-dependent protein
MSDYAAFLPANPGTDYPSKDAAQAAQLSLDSDKIDVAQLAYQFGYKRSTTTGLTLGYFGGVLEIDGAIVAIADGTIALSASNTNYLERTPAGVVSKNTAGFSADKIPMATVVCGASTITSITEGRAANWPLFGLATKSAAAGGTITLTAAEARAPILEFTGALPNNTSIELPNAKRPWIIFNNTTGAFTLALKVTGQPGVLVSQGMRATVYGNGVDIVPAQSDSAVPPGTMLDYGGSVIPGGYFGCDGANYQRATYPTLSGVLMRTSVVTFDNTTDKVAWTAHGLSNGDVFKFTTTGAAPTGLTAGTTYFLVNKGTDDFQLAATEGGAAINFTTNGTGTATGIHAPHGDGDGSTTFGVPDSRRRVSVGRGGSATSALGARLGASGGEEAHTLITAELAAHNHGVTDPGHTHGLPIGGSGATAGTTSDSGAMSPNNLQSASATTGISTQNAGSATPFNVREPSLVVTKIIKY